MNKWNLKTGDCSVFIFSKKIERLGMMERGSMLGYSESRD